MYTPSEKWYVLQSMCNVKSNNKTHLLLITFFFFFLLYILLEYYSEIYYIVFDTFFLSVTFIILKNIYVDKYQPIFIHLISHITLFGPKRPNSIKVDRMDQIESRWTEIDPMDQSGPYKMNWTKVDLTDKNRPNGLIWTETDPTNRIGPKPC